MNSGVCLTAYFRNHSLFSVSNVTFYLCTNGLQTVWQSTTSWANWYHKKTSHRNAPTFLRNWYMVYSFFSSQMFLKPKLVSFQEVFGTQLFAIQISGTCLSFPSFVSAVNGKRCTVCILSLICCCMSLLCCGGLFVGISLSNFSVFSHSLSSFLPFLPHPSPFPVPSYLPPYSCTLPLFKMEINFITDLRGVFSKLPVSYQVLYELLLSFNWMLEEQTNMFLRGWVSLCCFVMFIYCDSTPKWQLCYYRVCNCRVAVHTEKKSVNKLNSNELTCRKSILP